MGPAKPMWYGWLRRSGTRESSSVKFCSILLGLAIYASPAWATFDLPGNSRDRIASPIADKTAALFSTCATRNNACSGACVGNDAGKTCQPSHTNGACACQ
jgi:hypothetical protein